MADPPGYSDHSYTVAPPTVLLNLIPLANAVSFQTGYLGYGPASIRGELQCKWTGDDAHLPPPVSSVAVVFRGVETIAGSSTASSSIELCEHKQVLWGLGAAGPSLNNVSPNVDMGDARTQFGDQSLDFPPSTIEFKAELTPDLPHCIHLGHSSLDYSLTAILTYRDSSLAPVTCTVPVHLARTSAPEAVHTFGPQSTPQRLSVQDPVQLSVRLARTVFYRSEPIELAVRIEVPTVQAVQDDGIRLRTVSAQLVRKISVKTVEDDQQLSVPMVSPIEVDATHSNNSRPSDSASEGHTENAQVPRLPTSVDSPWITVLTRSGKSARFSPTRPIVIRLLLHPPTTSWSCESISQSTILHNVSFEVQVTVGLFSVNSTSASSSADQHQNRDCIVTQTVTILPDAPPPSSSSEEKQRFVESLTAATTLDAQSASSTWTPADGLVPTYHESAAHAQAEVGWIPSPPPLSPAPQSAPPILAPPPPPPPPAASPPDPPSANASGKMPVRDLDNVNVDAGSEELLFEGEEYDGYEEMSESLSSLAPPPRIDEDVSPPSPSAPVVMVRSVLPGSYGGSDVVGGGLYSVTPSVPPASPRDALLRPQQGNRTSHVSIESPAYGTLPTNVERRDVLILGDSLTPTEPLNGERDNAASHDLNSDTTISTTTRSNGREQTDQRENDGENEGAQPPPYARPPPPLPLPPSSSSSLVNSADEHSLSRPKGQGHDQHAQGRAQGTTASEAQSSRIVSNRDRSTTTTTTTTRGDADSSMLSVTAAIPGHHAGEEAAGGVLGAGAVGQRDERGHGHGSGGAVGGGPPPYTTTTTTTAGTAAAATAHEVFRNAMDPDVEQHRDTH